MNDISDKTSSRTKVIPVVDTMPADLLTPLSVYLKLSAGAANSFLLESVEGGTSLARYSFIGADPDFVVSGTDASIDIKQNGETLRSECGLLSFLKTHFSGQEVEAGQDLPAFIGGAIGFLGFECSEWFEPTLKSGGRNQLNDEAAAAFMFYRSIVAFDHAKQVIKIISLVFDDGRTDVEELTSDAAEQNKLIRAASLVKIGRAHV